VRMGFTGWNMDFADTSDFFDPILTTDSISERRDRRARWTVDSTTRAPIVHPGSIHTCESTRAAGCGGITRTYGCISFVAHGVVTRPGASFHAMSLRLALHRRSASSFTLVVARERSRRGLL